MKDFEKQLNSRLLYLPVSILGRVELFLTHSNFKEASSISVRKPFLAKESGTKRIIKWLTDAKIWYVVDKNDTCLVHISKSQKLATKIAEIQWSNSVKDVRFRGLSYGYPKDAVKLFTSDHSSLVAIKMRENVLSECYWKPYVRYMVRRGEEYKDSLIAKKWADHLRGENPKLAKWFESELSKI